MKIIAYLFIALVFVIILTATFQWENPIMPWVGQFKYGDKMAHLILIGTLAYCVTFLLDFRKKNIGNTSFYVGLGLVFVLITLEEFSQNWISTRTFDLIDLSANYIGIAIAWLIIKLQKKWRKGNN